MNGEDLLKMVTDRLLGYANVMNVSAYLDFLNEAKDEVWTQLKTLNQDYFGAISQNTDPTADDYFPTLDPTKREYVLPNDFSAIRFIEPTSAGYESIKFKFCNLESGEFQSSRRSANIDRIQSPASIYWYTIFGKNQFIMALYPEVALAVTLYYIRHLHDIIAFSVGTSSVTINTKDVTLVGTSYTVLQMNTMVGQHYIVNGLDFGLIAAVTQSTQHLTLDVNAPSTQNTKTYVVTDEVDEIVEPFIKKVADYAVKKVMLSAQADEWAKWAEEWKKDLLTLTTGAAPRNQADPQFVEDFSG